MKFYSEITNTKYDTEEACQKAEQEYLEKKEREETEKAKLAEARKEAAHDVEEARENCLAAKRMYEKTLSDFLKKYGSYHTTIKKEMIDDMPSLYDLMDRLFF